MSTETTQDAKEKVNRSRRSYFIFAVVSFCLLVSATYTGLAGFGIIAHSSELVSSFVSSLVSLATVCVLAYVGGSSIDYNGGILNLVKGK